jgi:hypothetical protein
MRALTFLFLSTVLTSSAQAGQNCEFLNAYDLSEEDVSIMLSVRPARAVIPETQLAMPVPAFESGAKGAMRVCYLRVPNTDPQLSVEAGWDPVIQKVNCETGEAVTGDSRYEKPAVTG